MPKSPTARLAIINWCKAKRYPDSRTAKTVRSLTTKAQREALAALRMTKP